MSDRQTALGQLPSKHPPGAPQHRRRGVDPDDVATGRHATKQLDQAQATAESDVGRPISRGDPARLGGGPHHRPVAAVESSRARARTGRVSGPQSTAHFAVLARQRSLSNQLSIDGYLAPQSGWTYTDGFAAQQPCSTRTRTGTARTSLIVLAEGTALEHFRTAQQRARPRSDRLASLPWAQHWHCAGSRLSHRCTSETRSRSSRMEPSPDRRSDAHGSPRSRTSTARGSDPPFRSASARGYWPTVGTSATTGPHHLGVNDTGTAPMIISPFAVMVTSGLRWSMVGLLGLPRSMRVGLRRRPARMARPAANRRCSTRSDASSF